MSYPTSVLNKLKWLKLQENDIQFIDGILITSIGPPILVPVPTSRPQPRSACISIEDLNVSVWVPKTERNDCVSVERTDRGKTTLGIYAAGYRRQCVTVIRNTAVLADFATYQPNGSIDSGHPNISKNSLLIKTESDGTAVSCVWDDVAVISSILNMLIAPDVVED